jgi:flagellar hook-length control protein FliK
MAGPSNTSFFSSAAIPAAAAAATPIQVPAEVATHISRALENGQQTLTIQLHPAELGRVEVHLSFHSDGLSVQMTLDRRETYDAFTRDRASLEQQFSKAGIDLGSGGLNLRFGQQSGQQSQRQTALNSGFNPVPVSPAAIARATSSRPAGNSLDILA